MVLNAVVVSLNLLTFILGAYNCKKYIWSRKDNRLLVTMFYIFVFTDTAIEMGAGVHGIIRRSVSNKDIYHTIFGVSRSINLACICLTDGLTMYSLAVSI